MSFESWRKKFYPVTAKEAAVSDSLAVKHSLQKWVGLRKENLGKHGLELPSLPGTILFNKSDGAAAFFVNCETCALCHRHYDNDCEGCPLVKNGTTCFDPGRPYDIFIKTGDAEPMIIALSHLNESLEMVGTDENS